jgi:prepilin-type N-terminal cleavage/methylation domain-containing protein
MFKRLKNKKGFTLIELLLSLVVSGIILGIASETMISQADTFSFISNRKNTIADIRQALTHISYDIKRVDAEDITDISSSNISFTNEEGAATSYKLDADGENLAIYKGSDILIPNVEDFTVNYYDENGDELDADADQIEFVKRIKFTIETKANAEEGNITLSTLIVPRSFLGYNNFQ